MGYNTLNFKSKDILYAHQLNTMDSQIATNDIKVTFLDGEIKKALNQVNSIPNWAKQASKPTYSPQEIGTYSSEEIDSKLQSLTGINLSNYYTKEEVDKLIPKNYITQDVLNNYVIASTLNDYVSRSYLSGLNYITSSTLDSYASKSFVTSYVDNIVFEGVDLTDYLTINDFSTLIDQTLGDYPTNDQLQEHLQGNYYNKNEVENLVLGGSLQDEIEAREAGDANLQEQISGLTISKDTSGDFLLLNHKKEQVGDAIVIPKSNLKLASDNWTTSNLKINNSGELEFIGELESIEYIGNLTINGKTLADCPTLNTSDITLSDCDGYIITDEDTISEALLKIDNYITWGIINK